MENASKALLMAGGVLIGILILSLAVYLFITFGAESKEIYAQMEEKQLTQYNAQYTIYSGRTDITIYDIISLSNLAYENNDYYKNYGNYEDSYKVIVSLTNAGADPRELQLLDAVAKQSLIEKYNGVDANGDLESRFTCSSIEYHSTTTGRVSKIIFKKNS